MSFTTTFFVDASNNINISGTTISIVSSAANEINLNNSAAAKLMTIKVGVGPPTNIKNLHTGSLYIDNEDGILYIYNSINYYWQRVDAYGQY